VFLAQPRDQLADRLGVAVGPGMVAAAAGLERGSGAVNFISAENTLVSGESDST
jgi:hypothetical protein